jgi:predicted aconitase
MDVSQVHVDGCIYTGPASLRFAQMLAEWGARVRVPTTLNAISVDQRRWRDQGVAESLGVPASALADAYVAMGARPSFTCAPYLLDSAPGFGEHIGWAESNAVVYANSVIGARTMKYPDYLDICIALTGGHRWRAAISMRDDARRSPSRSRCRREPTTPSGRSSAIAAAPSAAPRSP